MTTASAMISAIAILIALVLAWNAFGGAENSTALRDWWRRRRSGS